MGLVDTNCDPDPIDYVIACNDDALKSIKLILNALTDVIAQKKNEMRLLSTKEKDEDTDAEEKIKMNEEIKVKEKSSEPQSETASAAKEDK